MGPEPQLWPEPRQRTADTWLLRALRRPPGPILALLAVAASIGLMWATSVPTSDFDVAMLSLFAGLAVCALWLVRTLCSLITARRWSMWIVVVPVVVGLCLVTTSAELPLRLRFAAARGDFDRAVAAATADPTDHPRAGRIGSYRVDSVSVHGANVYFPVVGSGFLGQGGFAYLPSGPPPTPDPIAESVTVTPLTGPWFVFTSSW